MSALARIARLSAGFLGSNLARGGIAFALSLVVGRAVGVERFGAWTLCTAWASTLTVAADLGFGLLLPRDGARDSIGTLCGSALVVRLAFAVPAAVAIGFAAPELRVAALLGVSGAAYGCFGASFRSRPAWVPAVLAMETSWYGAQLAASWIALHAFGGGVGALLWVATAAQLLQVASALVMWRPAFGDGDPIAMPSWTTIRETFRRAIPFAAAGIVANLQTRVAPLMLGYLSTQSEIGVFAAAARFGTTARLAPGAIFAGALPVLSREHDRGRGDAEPAFRAFDRALAVVAIATALACVAFGRPLLRIAYGAAFEAAWPALLIIAVGLAPALTNAAARIALYAAGGETVATSWSAAALAGQIALGAILIPRGGAPGAAAAIALAEAAIWIPLRRARTAARVYMPSSQRRAPAPTHVHVAPGVPDVPDPAAAR